MLNDNVVIIKRPGGEILIRGYVGDDVNDIHIMQFPDGDIILVDDEDGERVIISRGQMDAVLSVLDLLTAEDEEESDEEYDYIGAAYEDGFWDGHESAMEGFRDGFADAMEEGEFLNSEFDPFDYLDGEMDEYLV